MAGLYERTMSRLAARRGEVDPEQMLLSSVLDDSNFRQSSGGRHSGETGEAYTQRVGADVANAKSGYEARVNQYLNDRNSRSGGSSILDTYLRLLSDGAPKPGGGSGGGDFSVQSGNRFETGLSSNERRLNALLDNPESVQQTAAYKFRLGQGQEALQRQMAAKGMLGSGNRLMELTKYGQDMASQEYDTQAKRLSDLVGMYSGNWMGDKNANTQRASAASDAAYKTGMLGVSRANSLQGWQKLQQDQKNAGGGSTFRMGGGYASQFDANPFDNQVADWNSMRPSAYKSWTDEERARSF